MNISDVYVFKKVATTMSFTEAAKQVGSSRSAISKTITRLEKYLGVVLINRTTRSISLTEAGRTLHHHTDQVDTMIEHAVDVIRGPDLQFGGTIAISLPSSLGMALMPSLIAKFQIPWPDLNFSIHFEDDVVDIIAGSYDLAIQVSANLTDSNLISRRLESTRRILVASPGYLSTFGNPSCIAELNRHRCLGLGSAVKCGATWRFQGPDGDVEIPCTFSVSANNELALIHAACLDNGMIYIPEIFISKELEQGRLLPVLQHSYVPETYGVFAIYPHRNAAEKVKALVNFFEQELKSLRTTNRCTRPKDCAEGNKDRDEFSQFNLGQGLSA